MVSTPKKCRSPSGWSLTGKKKVFRYPVFPKTPAGTPCVQPLVAVGGWRLAAIGGWQLATGGWWRLVVVGGGLHPRPLHNVLHVRFRHRVYHQREHGTHHWNQSKHQSQVTIC